MDYLSICFLQSHIEEKTEELEITYDLENRRSFTEIRKEDLPDILLVLDDNWKS